MAPELSTFEARRRANVVNNAKLLKDSAEVAAKMRKAAAPPPRAAAPKKRKAAEPAPRTRVMPTRQSARLAGAGSDTNGTGLKLEDIPAELKPPEPKRIRTSGDLQLSNLQVEGQRWSSTGALTSFVQGARPGVRTFTEEDIKDTSDSKLKDLRKGMSDLKLYEGWVPNDIKITPERVYALTFHPIQDKPVILAGDKKGTLGFFDASQETPPQPDEDDEDVDIPLPQVGAFEVHSRTISSIKVPMFDPNSVLTSSYDSSIRCLDLQSQVSRQLWEPEDDSVDVGISCIDVSPETKDVIVFSTLDGNLGRLDRRSKEKADMWSLSDNKIGGFSLHPLLPHLVATASLDRTLKIWDLRMIKGKGELRHPSLLGEHQSRLSVSHASWSRGGHLATSSYDDTVKVYDMSGAAKWKPGQDLSDEQMRPAHSIPHNNQTGRWVTILKPQWQARPADGVEKFAIANMNRFVDIYDGGAKQLAQLDGEGITAVPAVAEFHPTLNWLAGGTGSGKLCLWM
ncbi:WD repeat-containing protein NCU09302/NCU11420 [Annulohypoxylon truncatum]|uniref:WD repeat-containing protein NCU09302/NCU11420 n=1 Tax=Annulohypoxylon truncatum TaxID=327061 RepID=UPI0020075CA1|nr:WD repeat-containing protein NCU09302/NCU11420 [Annulohypoxylon truncatum]KAI1207498.1 WD repeat-containing protein NCU09302/NCU11420 [Annulohypoxylon truncatum]